MADARGFLIGSGGNGLMCLIIHKPEGIKVPETLIAQAWEDNPDGAGIMYRADDGLHVYKVMPGDWADPARHLASVIGDLEAREIGIHFRWKTHGPISRDNVHPFPIPGTGGYVMHNGVLSQSILGPHYDSVSHVMSDTAFYTLTALQNAPGSDDPEFWEIVGRDVGTYNKLLIMDALGRFKRVNATAWSVRDGLYLSNILSCEGIRSDWKRYCAAHARTYPVAVDRSDSGPEERDEGEAVVIYTGSPDHPAKLTRRERKVLNACLRANTWGPLNKLGGK